MPLNRWKGLECPICDLFVLNKTWYYEPGYATSDCKNTSRLQGTCIEEALLMPTVNDYNDCIRDDYYVGARSYEVECVQNGYLRKYDYINTYSCGGSYHSMLLQPEIQHFYSMECIQSLLRLYIFY